MCLPPSPVSPSPLSLRHPSQQPDWGISPVDVPAKADHGFDRQSVTTWWNSGRSSSPLPSFLSFQARRPHSSRCWKLCFVREGQSAPPPRIHVGLRREDGLQMASAPVHRAHDAVGNEPLCGFQAAKAPRRSVGGIEWDLLSHLWVHFGYGTEGKEFYESPVSRDVVWVFRRVRFALACRTGVFTSNIRKTSENCTHLASFFLHVDPFDPRLIHIWVVEPLAHFTWRLTR